MLSVDSPSELALDLRKRASFVQSRENVLRKRSFIAELSSLAPTSPPVVFDSIIHSLFSLARDINPVVRLEALEVLATTAVAPASLVESSLSKGENDPDSMADRPHVGTFGMCLEDAVPEVRAMAVRALAAAIYAPGDPSALEVMTALAPMIDDSSPAVRAAAISALSRVSRMVDHLVTLDDPQLRLVLPVLSAADGTERDRREVIAFLGRLKTPTRDQTIRVIEEFGKAVRLFPSDRESLAAAACAFGRNNACFLRLCAATICRTLSSIRNAAPQMSDESLIRMLAVASACLETPFVVVGEVGRELRGLMPVIIQWENARRATPAPVQNPWVALDELQERVASEPLAIKKILSESQGLADACDFVSAKDPPEGFRVDHGPGEVVCVTKYRGVIISPKENSRYSAFVYVPEENFFFEIIGKVTPPPASGVRVLVAIETPGLRGGFLFETPVDQDGQFVLKKTIVFPECNPFLVAKLKLGISVEEPSVHFISDPVGYWFTPKAPLPVERPPG
jgi:hypothetical protein